MKYSLSLSLTMLPKALNKSLRTHWRKRHLENKVWDALISNECIGRLPPTPLKRAHLTLIRFSHRELDFDGLVGSMKPVVDALVTCGVLEDDAYRVTGAWTVEQRFRPLKDGPLLKVIVECCSS